MAGRERPINTREGDVERSTEDIRQDIAKGEKSISLTVDKIDQRIQDKLEWREYVKDSPYWALGAVAGLGFLASGMFLLTRTTPLERIMGSIAGGVRGSLAGLLAGVARPNLMKTTLLGIATKAAAGWIMDAASGTAASGGAGSPPQNRSGSTIGPRVKTQKTELIR